MSATTTKCPRCGGRLSFFAADGAACDACPWTEADDAPPPAASGQVGGDHYKKLAVQPWDAMKAWMTPEEFSGYLRGSAIAYLARTGTVGVPGKGGIVDVQKAIHFLQKWVEVNSECGA